MNIKPPYRAYRFLKWFCKPSLFEEISGDLQEEFNRKVKSGEGLKAKIIYWLLVFSFLRPFALGIKIRLFNMTLFRNHALIALRMMVRHKVFTLINVLGLTLSMIIGLVLITIIVDQKSFDKFQVKRDRIYRITTKSEYMTFGPSKMATTALPLANELSRDNIEELVRIRRNLSTDMVAEDKTIPVFGHFADCNFFSVFSFDLLSGDPATALKDPYSLVITEKLAQKIFNKLDVIGQTVTLTDLGEYTITGIVKDIPRQSHMQFELLVSFSTVPILEQNEVLWPSLNNWQNYSSNYIYFLLKENGNIHAIQSELDRIADIEYSKYPDLKASFSIQPLTNIALGTDMGNQIGPTTEKEFIMGVSILAFVIFLAAIFNYTNLSVARSIKRSREVGLRKVMGSTKSNIIAQFILESVIISFLSLGVAMLIFEAVKPALDPYLPNRFVSLDLTPTIFGLFMAFALMAGLISGVIPSIVMSRINIAEILKQNSVTGIMKRINIRKGVLVFQFTLSMVFIVVSIVAWRQYTFGINYDTGFKKDNIYNLFIQGHNPDIVKAKFMQIPEVMDMSFSGFVLSSGTIHNTWVRLDDPTDSMLVGNLRVDENYTALHEIKLLAGHPFSTTGGDQVMINKYTLDYFNITDPAEVIGQKMKTSGGLEVEVSGVTTNFFTNDVGREQGGFILIFQPENQYGIANLAVNYTDKVTFQAKVEKIWREMDEGVHEFRGGLFIDQLKDSYDGLTFIMKFVGTLAGLVILIASLGLLGMVIYSVEQRIREIGIRKTMGAGELKIIKLLSFGFFKLVAIAGSIAFVISWIIVFKVILTRVVDKPDIGIAEFLLAFMILLLPALLAIFPAVVKASRTNPAVILRSE